MEYLRKNIFVKSNKKGINGVRDAIKYIKKTLYSPNDRPKSKRGKE